MNKRYTAPQVDIGLSAWMANLFLTQKNYENRNTQIGKELSKESKILKIGW